MDLTKGKQKCNWTYFLEINILSATQSHLRMGVGVGEGEKQTDRQLARQAGRQARRQTDRQTDL